MSLYQAELRCDDIWKKNIGLTTITEPSKYQNQALTENEVGEFPFIYDMINDIGNISSLIMKRNLVLTFPMVSNSIGII